MSVTFQVKDKFFTIPKDTAVVSIYLLVMMDFASTCELSGPIKLDVDMESMIIIYELLINEKIPDADAVPILDFFDIDCSSSYELSLLHGAYYIKYHEVLNRDKSFGLQYITKEYWDKFQIKRRNDINLLFNHAHCRRECWDNIKKSLKQLDSVHAILNREQ